MKKVAVIILHFGEIKNTLNCLQSLNKIEDKKNIKVYIIDNGTNSISKGKIISLQIKSKIIKSSTNLGFSGGNNLGIKEALKEGYKYIFILNNDAVIRHNTIEKLIEPFNTNEFIGITCPIITYYQNPERIWFAGGYLNKSFCYTRHSLINKTLNEYIDSKEIGFATGAAMMIKREVFDKIGLFSEDYFLYWEDVDFCTRARKKRYISYLVNKPLVFHKVSSSTGTEGKKTLSPIKAYYYARNPFIFIKNNNFPEITGFLGQLFIRFPYYMLSIKDFTAFKSYIKGLIYGIKILLFSI